LFEVRNAKPAIFNGQTGSAVKSQETALPLDSQCPVTLPPGLPNIPTVDGAKGPEGILRQPLVSHAFGFLIFPPFKRNWFFFMWGSLRFIETYKNLQTCPDIALVGGQEEGTGSNGTRSRRKSLVLRPHSWIVNCLLRVEISKTGQDR
jgi:hypothetical protein